MFKRNNLIVFALIVLFILTGFFREFVFVNWNEQIRVTYYNAPDSNVHPMMEWLSSFSYEALYWLKWPITLFFSVLFAGLATVIIHFIFNSKAYNRIALYAYGATFLFSFLFFGLGWLIGFRDIAYPVARFLAGLIETPAMLVVLIAAFLVHRKL